MHKKILLYLFWICLLNLTILVQVAAGHENKDISREQLDNARQSVEEYRQKAGKNPENYAYQWKAARACWVYTELCQQAQLKDWRELSVEYGKMGMEYARMALELEPQKIEGHLYYGLCSDSYTDGNNVVFSLLNSIKGKIKTHLQEAYRINKHYQDGLPILALGRYWQLMPEALGGDKARALELYREARQVIPEDIEYRTYLQLYMGELLLELDQDRGLARKMLSRAAQAQKAFFRKKAEEIMRKYFE